MLFFLSRRVPRRRLWPQCLWLTLASILLSDKMITGARAEFSYEAITAVLARININYQDPISQEPRSVTAEIGRFADGAIGAAAGVLLNPKPNNSTSGTHYLQGCVPNWASPTPRDAWIALLLRGGCTDAEKVTIAKAQNASAVLFFGSDNETYLQKETKFSGDVVVVYLLRRKGEQLSYLMMNGTRVFLSISRGQEVKFRITSINKTSVLFVSVSFIVLMVVSLAWLIFYYIQRFRYINAKDKLARHLCHVAKKALAKVPVKNIKSGDKELVEIECCAICIEPYQVADTLRTLPCRHEFHKGCVDPWLLEHRTCPMCKMDILKHYGFLSSTVEEGSRGGPPVGDQPGGESGGSLINRNPPPPHLRSSSETPQISVISHSEVASRIESSDQTSSSNPVETSAMPFTRHPSSGFGATTTAMIRSMINSARPPRSNRVSPDPSIRPLASDPVDVQLQKEDDAKTIENNWSSNPTYISEEGASTSSQADPPSPDAVSVAASCCSCSSGRHCERCDSVSDTDDPSTSQPTTNARDSMCDLECLVKEIMDLDFEAASDKSRTESPPQIITSSENDYSRRSSKKIQLERHPVSECPVALTSSVGLPKVDCDHHTALTIDSPSNFEYIERARNFAAHSSSTRRKSSTQHQDLQEPFAAAVEDDSDDLVEDSDASRRSSVEIRRPSSHLITITHS